jgi:hypothetical protein
MNKQDYQRIIYGATIGILSLLLLLYMMKLNKSAKILEPKTNFEVVDTYNGCAVVRWNNNMLANYQYFLDCTK